MHEREKFRTFLTDSLLDTPIACEAPDLVVDDVVAGAVELRGKLLGGDGETDRVGNALALEAQKVKR